MTKLTFNGFTVSLPTRFAPGDILDYTAACALNRMQELSRSPHPLDDMALWAAASAVWSRLASRGGEGQEGFRTAAVTCWRRAFEGGWTIDPFTRELLS